VSREHEGEKTKQRGALSTERRKEQTKSERKKKNEEPTTETA
jgi:hypothetical protein